MSKSRSVTWLKIAGACGIITPITAFACIFLAIYSAPEFSWVNNALSDLSVMPGVTAAIFNYGLITSGILGATFATGLSNALRLLETVSAKGELRHSSNRGRVGALLFLSACIALTAIGVFPEDVRPMHFIASVAFFVLLICALLGLSSALWQFRQKTWAAFTLLLDAAAAAPWLLLFAIRYVSGVAIPEFVAAVAGGVWAAVFGFKMLQLTSHEKTS
ncbi:MAG: DUF998 domain-containing protein [Candidatus Bathyarchaeota archaeon]|nr:DUF998 domain-containing protein [Candidatus Bathyarchaeota archaeon]